MKERKGEMNCIAGSLIVDGAFKNVLIPPDMLNELATKLREEGKYTVYTSVDKYDVEGFLVIGKGSNKKLMVFADDKEG
ncbi:hypothetical protein M4D71_00610 [Niallia taxi]|uniref:hypothetical protein n=1 Tax=Niallia taxi TaxID=2499688 RepID=UPI0021A395C9|nr:hypothetical protein [Niallia taxi]MCT2342620.1 hypothetical protein [Niallia taxi]